MSADIARRAVVCPGWRWLPGMLAIRWTGPCRGSHRYTDADVRAGVIFYDGFPDLDDPATLGCLLALVREAVEPRRAPGEWPVVCTYQSQGKNWGVGAWLNESGKATFAALVLPTYETEAAALVAALEAAA